MAIRNDIYIDWVSSPRIITILAPSEFINIQDLVDTCRYNEALITNIQFPQIISAAGKDSLGSGVYVGLTATLLNAVVAFEARPGPEFIQCSIDGGNLVATDYYGNNISPVKTTSFTQVLRTSSSSATLQELADIQYSSFSNGITIDLNSSYSGTTYPNGTPRQPVNNFDDALLLANSRGFSKLYIKGDALIDHGLNYSGKIFYGESITKSTLTITSLAQVAGCMFYDATIQGTLDGGSTIKGCEILDLNYVNGIIDSSILHGTIELSGDAIFLDCWGDNETTPVIDFANSSAALTLSNYNGRIVLKNKPGQEPATIELNSGLVILENTITSGLLTIRGIGQLIDHSNGATVDYSYLLNPKNITNSILNEPISSHQTVGSIADAISKAGLSAEEKKQLLMIFIKSL